MRGLIRSELLRTFSGRVLLWLGGLSALLDMLSVFGNGKQEQHLVASGAIGAAGAEQALVTLGFGSLLFATLAGALAVTSEYRHHSISRSLVIARGQHRLLAAKLVASLVPGALMGTIGSLTALCGTWIWASTNHHRFVWNGSVVLTAAGVFLVSVLSAPWGVAIGWVVRRQLPCLVGIMAWTLVAETAIESLFPSVGMWLPGGAQEAIYRDSQSRHFAMGAGVCLLLAWIALAAGTALWSATRRDFS